MTAAIPSPTMPRIRLSWQVVAFAALCIVGMAATAEEPKVTYHIDKSGDRTPLQTVVPAYPERARRDRIEGEVQVCYNVTRSGKPQRISVRRSTHRIFEKPAIRAVRASKYKPLEADKKLSGIKTCRTFRFMLEPVEADAPPPS